MWRVKSDASFRSNLRDNKIDKTKQIANILREIPPPSKMPEFKVDRTMFSDSSAPLLSNREHQPALTYRPSPHASQPPVSVWNDAKHREMMERMSSSLQHCQHLLVSVRKKLSQKPSNCPLWRFMHTPLQYRKPFGSVRLPYPPCLHPFLKGTWPLVAAFHFPNG